MSTAPSTYSPLTERLRAKTLTDVSMLMLTDDLYRLNEVVNIGRPQGMRQAVAAHAERVGHV